MNHDKAVEIFSRLAQNTPLDDLGISKHNGRLDVRYLSLSPIEINDEIQFDRWTVHRAMPPLELEGADIENVDFSNSKLEGIRFEGCEIRNCVFDKSNCQHWRMWDTKFIDCSFKNVDLKHSALGGIINHDKRNLFQNVAFVKADLRDTSYSSAVFEKCLFDNCNLSKVEFNGSLFKDCKFSGLLNEVIFCNLAFDGKWLPPNIMENVDFRHSTLKCVDFRKLNMDKVLFPNDDRHIIINCYIDVLEYLLTKLSPDDPIDKLLRGDVEYSLKWAGPEQNIGIINKDDMLEFVGEEGLRRLESLIKEANVYFEESESTKD